MKQAICSIIAAVFNIAIIILQALGHETASKILVAVAPEVNIIAVAILWFFGYKDAMRLKDGV
ncbi:MAG: hypothetical protein Pg6A_19920 [Termitinemataceae bacterium]|nr:MAG: hypothetical protein Pg6A_19920 [Termitinemataceae bacterium]